MISALSSKILAIISSKNNIFMHNWIVKRDWIALKADQPFILEIHYNNLYLSFLSVCHTKIHTSILYNKTRNHGLT